MKDFMEKDFLLSCKAARILYHEFAEGMPIFDYHCHLDPKEIAADKKFGNITEAWLGGDHYKWRAMRSNGVDEAYITGNAEDKEKFLKWAETLPYCIGNPLYHWTHLELKRFFGIDKILSPDTAEEIWQQCNAMLNGDAFSARNLIMRSKVRVICTTDDPADSLEYHGRIAKDGDFSVKVLPTFRPDKYLNIDAKEFSACVEKLGRSENTEIRTLDDLKDVLAKRIRMFHQAGCRIADHALEPVPFEEASEKDVEMIFTGALNGNSPKREQADAFKTHMFVFLAEQYARNGWAMQLHLGCIRNVNSRAMERMGPNAGFDTITDRPFAEPFIHLLDLADRAYPLPKTILYCLNAAGNDILAALAGCFQGDVPGKIQLGPAWWFNDNEAGITKQLLSLANMGLLGRFVGMLTDSRSFFSYPRHEYFRRILCNLVGAWAENGEVALDYKLLGGMIRDICFSNAERYFGIEG